MRCDGSNMVGIRFWNSRVLEGKMREIGVRKLRRLMVYDKVGLPVFKSFLFISQLFVLPSLNVATTNDLEFVPFLLLCSDIQK